MGSSGDPSRGKAEPSNSGRERRKIDPPPVGRNAGPQSRTPIQEEPPVQSLQARLGLGDMSDPPLSFIRADSMARKEDDKDYRKRTASGTSQQY